DTFGRGTGGRTERSESHRGGRLGDADRMREILGGCKLRRWQERRNSLSSAGVAVWRSDGFWRGMGFCTGAPREVAPFSITGDRQIRMKNLSGAPSLRGLLRKGGIPRSPPSRDFLEPHDRKSGRPHLSPCFLLLLFPR